MSDEIDTSEALSGVTVGWLCRVFRIQRHTAERRLQSCKPLRMQGKRVIYDVAEAAAYLIKPKLSVEHFVKNIRPDDLPTKLQEKYWDALIKKQKFMTRAGQLWHTNDVMDAFSSIFKSTKNAVQLWVDIVDEQETLTAEQRKLLHELCDSLLEDIHYEIKQLEKKQETLSSAADLDDDDVEVEDVE